MDLESELKLSTSRLRVVETLFPDKLVVTPPSPMLEAWASYERQVRRLAMKANSPPGRWGD